MVEIKEILFSSINPKRCTFITSAYPIHILKSILQENDIESYLNINEVFMVIKTAGKYKQYLQVISGDKIGWILYNFDFKEVKK